MPTSPYAFDDIYGGRFMTAGEVPNPIVGTIKYVEWESFARPGQKEETKAVVYLEEHKKGIVLNKTNARNLADAFSKDFTTWPGQRIQVRAERTSMSGKPLMGLRTYPATLETKLNDAIPF